MRVRIVLASAVACFATASLIAGGIVLGTPPAAPARPRGLSSAERSRLVQQELDRRWRLDTGDQGFLTQPNVPILRFTTTQDAGPVFAHCMTVAGYPTSYTLQQGLVGPTVAAKNYANYSVQKYVCQAQYPTDPVELGYFSTEQSQFLYNYWANVLTPCLRGQGVPVPPLPKRYPFGSSAYPNLSGPWDPYEKVRTVRGNAIAPFIFTRCPEFPPQLYSKTPARQPRSARP